MKKSREWIQSIISNPLYGLLVILVILTLANSWFRGFDHDELEAIHTAWKMAAGEVIYVDFFQHHNPLFYYVLEPFLWVFSDDTSVLRIARLFMFTMYAAVLFVTYKLALLVLKERRDALLSVVVLAGTTYFFDKAIEVRPDVPQVLFGLMSIYWMFLYFDKRKLMYALLSGVSLGISFLFLQKAIFLILIIGLILARRLFNRSMPVQEFFYYWLAFAATVLPYALYLLLNDQFSTYITFNWLLNMKFSHTFSPVSGVLAIYQKNTLVWLFFIVGVACMEKGVMREILFLVLALMGSLLMVKAPYPQYYMMFLPLVAVVAALGARRMFQYPVHYGIAAVVASALPIFVLATQVVLKNNSKELAKIEYVRSNTKPDDFIYDGEIYFNLFRRDIDYFWFSVRPGVGGLATYQSITPYSYDVYESIRKYKPALISLNYLDKDMPIIKNNYFQSDKYPDLWLRKSSDS
ncbi:MAG: glycosyltransferase family 39 protein [Gammaproteobacteria bacterium]|nr:glycosyltransferase family 39 protein [Gammaproteobacteria bacterium]MDH5799223.1 glycosyltransferase family 39 protein [Gammaproteobacteria bacterium]